MHAISFIQKPLQGFDEQKLDDDTTSQSDYTQNTSTQRQLNNTKSY